MPAFALIVPCRLASTRFPRKLLHLVKGKPLVLWVAERLTVEAPDFPLWFAVDDLALETCLEDAGYRTVPTAVDHPSGTDRLAEANRRIRASYVINVQADEPLVTGAQVSALVRLIQGDCPMATLCTPFARVEDWRSPNQVKVVRDAAGRALYFSRSPLPYVRDRAEPVDDAWLAGHPCYKHLGLYAYRADFLETFVRLPPGRLEQLEKLEQLRALEHGHPIAVGESSDPTIGVDTPEDAAKFAAWLG